MGAAFDFSARHPWGFVLWRALLGRRVGSLVTVNGEVHWVYRLLDLAAGGRTWAWAGSFAS